MTLGIGVIGAGVMGAYHAQLFARQIGGARLAAVSDPDTTRAETVAGGARVHAQGQALIDDPDVDAVLIAAPDAVHHGLVMAAIAAGKPVLCEKPLAATTTECRDIVAADAGRDLVSTGFMRRFDPTYRDMKAALEGGEIGTPLIMRCVHRNQTAPDWFTGPMIITNAMVHEIDLCRWMLGAEYTSARITPVGDRGDCLLAELGTTTGVVVRIEVFMNAAYGYHVQGEIVGRAGTVAMAEPALTRLRRDNGARADYPTNWIARFAESYRLQDQAWVDACRTGTHAPGIATARDGLLATDYCIQLVGLLERGGEGALHAALQ